MLCFKNMAELIISDKWYSDRKSDKADEARRIIIETAAKLIRCSIRDDLNKQKETYPSSEEVSSKWISETLGAFLQCFWIALANQQLPQSFLNNSQNKQKLINLLSDELELSGNIVVRKYFRHTKI